MLAVILAAGGTHASIGKLVLTGVAGGALTGAAINGVLTRADIYAAQDAMQWLTGSLNVASWQDIAQVGLCLLVLLPLCAVLTPAVDALGTGDALAAGLGVRVQGVRLTALALAVTLVAVAAATVGPVAFVSFMAAPIARGIGGGAGHAHHAALVGAVLMVVSDYVAAEAFPNLALPVGVVTAAAGAPCCCGCSSDEERRRHEPRGRAQGHRGGPAARCSTRRSGERRADRPGGVVRGGRAQPAGRLTAARPCSRTWTSRSPRGVSRRSWVPTAAASPRCSARARAS